MATWNKEGHEVSFKLFIFYFFYKKILQEKKAQNHLQRTKINVYKKHQSSKINEVIKFFNQFRLYNLVF